MERGTYNREWVEQGWVDRVLKRCPDESESEALTTYWSWRGPA
jgi:hypothetical protein